MSQLSPETLEAIADAVARRLRAAERGFGYVDRPSKRGKPPRRRCKTEGCEREGKYLGWVYLGREGDKEEYYYLGYYCSPAERKAAQVAWKLDRGLVTTGLDLPEPVRRKAGRV